MSEKIDEAIEMVKDKREAVRLSKSKEVPPLPLVLSRIIEDLEKIKEG